MVEESRQRGAMVLGIGVGASILSTRMSSARAREGVVNNGVLQAKQ